MDDPTSILQQQIFASKPSPAEESKIAPVQEPAVTEAPKEEAASKPSYMSMAAEAPVESAAQEGATTSNAFESPFVLPQHLNKHKSQTPMPYRKTRAGSYNANGNMSTRPFILGICGGPSSGMSTVAQNIRTELTKSNISTAVISLANFYRPIRGNVRKNRSRAGSLVEEENKEEVLREIAEINETTDFDDPQQLDFELLIRGVEQLRQRKPFNFPVYDKFYKIRLQSEQNVTPSDVIIVEGALIFCSEPLRRMFDLSLYIDTDDDVRLSRRVLKNAQNSPDVQIPLSNLLKTYEEKTKPAFEKYIEPTKKYANIIIPNYGFSPDNFQLDRMTIQGVDVIITDIKSTISQQRDHKH